MKLNPAVVVSEILLKATLFGIILSIAEPIQKACSNAYVSVWDGVKNITHPEKTIKVKTSLTRKSRRSHENN